MANAKHTPGPWRVEEGTTLVWGHCNRDDLSDRGMGYPIADARITPISNWAKGPDADAGEANARLIAAAPDMLEALSLHKAWTDSERAGPDYGGQTRGTHPDAEAIWRRWWDYQIDICGRANDAIDAALAKARGEG